MLESVIRDKSYHILHLITFLAKNSIDLGVKICETQLLSVMEHWSRLIDDGTSTDVIYLDFQKAFDKVPHLCLLSKLKA